MRDRINKNTTSEPLENKDKKAKTGQVLSLEEMRKK
jgi:hypothetical protein